MLGFLLMKRVVYILGNPLVDIDNLPIKLLPELQKHCPNFSFVSFDPTEDLSINNETLIFIDTVLGINKVVKFNDLNYFSLSPRVTTHDFDLSISLKLLQKLGKIKKVAIIGIPEKGNQKKILKEIKNLLKSI